jgi:DNA-directed RNA polymerase subunit RPC12/RpoP
MYQIKGERDMTHEEALCKVKGYLTDIIPTEDYSEVEEIIKALKQQPCRDMEEIREVMSCDADAETKCKMISYILTAKPHYFEKQTVQDKQAESEKYQKAFEDGYANGYAQARFDYEQEPCDDAISRQAVLNILFYKSDNNGEVRLSKELRDRIKNLLSVTVRHTGEWIKSRCDMYVCSECDHIYTDLSGERYGMNYCPNCGSRMVEPQESEDEK